MLDSERLTIAMLVNDPGSAIVRALDMGLCAAWFADDTCRLYFMAIKSLFDGGGATGIDMVQVYDRFTAMAHGEENQKKFAPCVGLDWLTETVGGYVSSASLEYHIGRLRDGWMAREVRQASLQYAQASSRGVDTTSCIMQLRGALDRILSGSVVDRDIGIGRVISSIMGEYREAHQRRVVEGDLTWTPGYTFPWPAMTALLNGLEPGLGIIAARPSVGKTLFALNLIRYWVEHGVRVLFDSLDMSSAPMVRRMMAEVSRVSIRKAKYTPTERNLTALQQAGETIQKWPLSYVEIRDVDDFCSYVRLEQMRGGAQIVVVDYLGLMQSARVDNANEYARVSYVSDKLKELANTLRVPVIALCQLNREIAKGEPGRLPSLSDLRGSGSIEQDAYWVAFLHRDKLVADKWEASPPLDLIPDVMQQNPRANRLLSPVHFVVAKSQNGETGALPFVFWLPYFMCQLGDYDARPIVSEIRRGIITNTIRDNSPRFARVHSDWRRGDLEDEQRVKGTLIETGDAIAV